MDGVTNPVQRKVTPHLLRGQKIKIIKMSFKKLSYFLLIFLLTLASCGKKGPLEHLKDEKRPKFDKVIDEEN